MRVLWFTTIPPFTNRLGNPNMPHGSGTWVDSLRLAIRSNPTLKLGVAWDSETDYKPFEEDGTSFYSVLRPRRSGTIDSMIRRWLHTDEYPNGLSNCLNIIEEFKPDIIHVHGSENFFGKLIKETSIPVVISIQGILLVCERCYFGGFTFSDKFNSIVSRKFIRGTGSIHSYLTMKQSAYREMQILKACKYFIGRTEFDKNFVSLVNPNSNYYHCDDVLRSHFYSSKWSPESLETQIVYCNSSPFPYKGLDCLLNAINLLKTNGFPEIQLRISGQIQDSDIWAIIKRKVQALNLTNEVVWLGISSSDEIVSELKKANVFVLPSYIENSPCALGEAMLVGDPCIASYVGGVPSEICHGIDGLNFPAGDAYSLAGMIAKIFRNPSLAKSLSKGARITAKKRHDIPIIAKTIIDIYSDVIDDYYRKKDA
jgi:glycosyltransferase involved in cell wall biosynthesis